jgi:hypothetical protein
VSTHIGILCVDWAPKPLGIPPAAKDTVDIQYHGPLPLIDSSTIKFLGPACYIETAPFETSVSIHPTSPRVGTPFEIVFPIMNKANVHQVISVSLTEIERESSLLVGGTTKGDLRLAPQGTQLISYHGCRDQTGESVYPFDLDSVAKVQNVACQRYRNCWSLYPTIESQSAGSTQSKEDL